MKLVLVRHATTTWNRVNRVQGHTDIELDEGGSKEALVLAKRLSGLGIQKIISSDLKRAQQTANIIATELGLDAVIDVRLRECSFGELEGMTREEMAAKHGTSLKRHLDISHKSWDFSRFGGETRGQVLGRHQVLVAECLKQYPDETICLVGHGRGLNTLLVELGDAPDLQRGEYRIIEL